MRLPDFLVIGAMKAGTTTLFQDLSTSMQVFFPADKEPGNLTGDRVTSEQGLAEYRALFLRAKQWQICGEASTVYTKLPDVTGCARRAAELLGPNLKLIYLVREPVSRTISQHNHEFGMRLILENIDTAIQKVPRLIDYSRYAMQLRPWLEEFDLSQFLIVRFEDYVADRRSYAEKIAVFLGLEPSTLTVDSARRFNVSSDKVVDVGPMARIVRSRIYRAAIRPFLGRDVRHNLARFLLPRNRSDIEPPSLATIDYILDRVAGECDELRRLIGVERPLWDLDQVRADHAQRLSTCESVPGGIS